MISFICVFQSWDVVQCIDWHFSWSYRKIPISLQMMIFMTESGSSVNRSISLDQIFFRISFYSRVKDNFRTYFCLHWFIRKILFSCLFLSFHDVSDHPNVLTSVFLHNFINFSNIFFSSCSHRSTGKFIIFNFFLSFGKKLMPLTTAACDKASPLNNLLKISKRCCGKLF